LIRALLTAFAIAHAATAWAAAPRTLSVPGPVRVLDGKTELGRALVTARAPSLAAPHRLLVVGRELWIASDGGVARLPSDLRKSTPLMIRDADGASLGASYDLVRVRNEIWVATDHGVVRVRAQTGAVIARVLSPRHVVALDESGLAATDRGVVRVADGRVIDPARSVHALLRCGGKSYGIADGRVLEFGTSAATSIDTSVVTAIGCAGKDLIVGSDGGVRWPADDEARGTGFVTAVSVGAHAVLIGTLGDGLRFAARDSAPPRCDERGRVWAIAADRDAWLVAIDDALLRVGARGEVERRMELIGPRGLVTAVESDGESAWVGTFDDGLYRLEAGRYRRVPVPDARITALLRHDNRLLVGTAAGLYARSEDGSVSRVEEPQGRLRRHISALRRVDGKLLVGSYPGALMIGAAPEPIRYYTGRSEPAQSRAETALFATTVFGAAGDDETLRLATQDGIERARADGAALMASVDGVLPDDWVNDVGLVGGELLFVLADRGVGWIGPAGTTLLRMHLTTSGGSLRTIGAGALFAGDGALVYARHDAIASHLTRYDGARGVDLVVSALAFDDGADRLWVGGVGGVLRVDHARRQIEATCTP